MLFPEQGRFRCQCLRPEVFRGRRSCQCCRRAQQRDPGSHCTKICSGVKREFFTITIIIIRMKTISSYVWVSLVLLGAISCTNSDFKKTKSGLLYKIYSDGKGPTAKKGEFLKGQVSEKLRD